MPTPSIAMSLPVGPVTVTSNVPVWIVDQLATGTTCLCTVVAWVAMTVATKTPLNRTCTVPHDAHFSSTKNTRLAWIPVRLIVLPCVLVEYWTPPYAADVRVLVQPV